MHNRLVRLSSILIAAAIGALSILSAGALPTRAAVTLPPGDDAVVTKVVDGDTIQVKIAGKKYTVRYIGMDTPETVKPGTPVQCFGKEASAFNRKLVNGKKVRLVKDVSETDKYGRLLRYVYLADGRMVNEELLKGGYAQVSTYPPDVLHVDQFLELQRAAREAGAGLWSKCAAAEPTATPEPVVAPAPETAPAASAPCDCAGPDLDCKDFGTQASAQACWDFCGGSAGGPDPHRLDGNDKDGRVCESLP